MNKKLLAVLSLVASLSMFAACSFGETSSSETSSSEAYSSEPECTHETTEAKHDKTNHWDECECGEKLNIEKHNYSIAKSDDTHHWNECECGAKSKEKEHAAGSEVKSDATNHWYECACGKEVNVEAHSYTIVKSDDTHHWNECECGASDEKVAHVAGSEVKLDATNHWYECECGKAMNVEAHSYTIVKSDDTHHWNECECGASDEKVAHVAGSEVKSDETNHWYECECGKAMNVEAHSYTIEKSDDTHHWNECECGAKSEVEEHVAGSEVKSDETNHWNECECGKEMNVEAHVAGTETKMDATYHWNECECGAELNKAEHVLEGGSNATHHWGRCECGYIVEEAEHNYNIVVSDETSHWNKCVCGATQEKEEHSYNTAKFDYAHHWNECECGAKSEVEEHVAGSEVKSDETNHWYECECGKAMNVEAHSYDTEKSDDAHHWNECECGAIDGKVEHSYNTAKSDETYHWNECECGAIADKAEHIYDTAKSDETYHWNECECGASDEKVAHVAGSEVKSDETSHWYECECGKAMNVEAHSCDTAKFDETHHWYECECGAKSELEEHVYIFDETDAAVDKLSCDCGLESVFNKVVMAERQTIALDAAGNTLNLEGISEYESVVLVDFNGYGLGTDLNALVIPDELKADTANHGEQTVTVCVKDKAGYEHMISVPVTFVTKTLTTVEDLQLLQIQTNTAAVYGYYVLGGDITSTSAIVAPGGWTEGTGETNDGTQGFCGVLDGNGYTITTPAGPRGLFGTIGQSVIKNVTFNCTSINSNDWATTFLARLAVGATFENVTINLSNITSGPKGAIVELATRDCDFINVKINIEGTVQNLFGAHTGASLTMGMNAAQADYPDTLCTFTNCVINLKKEDSTLGMLGQCYNGTEYNTYIVNGCDTTEGITVEGIKLTSPRPDVKLTNQDVLTTSATVSLDLGEYASYPVKAISLNGEDIGTADVSAITIPADIKADPSKHGTGSLFTVVVDKDGEDYKIGIPVTFITAEIATAADFAMVQLKSSGSSVYGYYVLTADIGATTAIAALSNDYYTADANGNAGFMGTLDGRNHTITCAFPTGPSGGLFGAIGNGAVIKNVTFDVPTAASGWRMALLGGSVVGATFDNVDFNFQNISTNEVNYGLLAGFSVANCTFKDVEFNLSSTHWRKQVAVLFATDASNNNNDGFNAALKNPCTFENCKINLAAGVELAQIGYTTNADGTKTIYVVDGCTDNGVAIEGTKVEGLTIVKATA